MESGIFIKNGVIIAVILTVVFLSQQTYARPVINQTYAKIGPIISPYVPKTGNWFGASILPQASGEVAKRGAAATKEITTQKNNLLQNVWENIKGFAAAKFSQTFGTKVQ